LPHLYTPEGWFREQTSQKCGNGAFSSRGSTLLRSTVSKPLDREMTALDREDRHLIATKDPNQQTCSAMLPRRRSWFGRCPLMYSQVNARLVTAEWVAPNGLSTVAMILYLRPNGFVAAISSESWTR